MNGDEFWKYILNGYRRGSRIERKPVYINIEICFLPNTISIGCLCSNLSFNNWNRWISYSVNGTYSACLSSGFVVDKSFCGRLSFDIDDRECMVCGDNKLNLSCCWASDNNSCLG